MVIRKTAIEDIDAQMRIYEYARKFMADHGNPNQWGPTNWPKRYVIEDDIKSGNSYVILNDDNKVIGTFYYIYGDNIDKTYLNIENGKWEDDSAYGVVHRLAGDGSIKGIGEFALNWAFEKSDHLRVDTHEDNTVMQNLLEKNGFERRGIIHVIEDNYPRIAYEKSR